MRAARRRQGTGSGSALRRQCAPHIRGGPRLETEPEGGSDQPSHPVKPTESLSAGTVLPGARTPGAGRARTPSGAGARTPTVTRARTPSRTRTSGADPQRRQSADPQWNWSAAPHRCQSPAPVSGAALRARTPSAGRARTPSGTGARTPTVARARTPEETSCPACWRAPRPVEFLAHAYATCAVMRELDRERKPRAPPAGGRRGQVESLAHAYATCAVMS